MRTRELNLADGGPLLPLDGPPVTMTGTLRAARVRLGGPVHLRGGLRGPGVERFMPVTYFPNNATGVELFGDYTLAGSARVAELLQTSDLARAAGRSFREIEERAVPLRAGAVPVRMVLADRSTVSIRVRAGLAA